jgi:hypothetical protein
MFSYTAITIDVAPDIADAVINDLKTAPRKFRKAYREDINQLAKRAIATLARPAPPVKYPIRWKTERQRRAFFASDGFGRGIPTRRTGAINKGWKYEIVGDINTGLFTIYNDATSRNYFTGEITFYEIYVQGIEQQPFHRITGWQSSQDVLANVMVEAENVLIERWYQVNGAT